MLMSSMNIAYLEDFYSDSEGEELTDPGISKDTVVQSKVKKLVSYCDDVLEDSDSESEEVKLNLIDNSSPKDKESSADVLPEPTGQCETQLQDKIVKMMRKMKETQCDWNRVIQERKSFRNPSIYEKLIEFCGIDEFGSNYEPDKYDPTRWKKGSFYDELNSAQMEAMDKRKDKVKIEFVVGVAKASVSGSAATRMNLEEGPIKDNATVKNGKRKKSKWGSPTTRTTSLASAVTRGAVLPSFQFGLLKKSESL